MHATPEHLSPSTKRTERRAKPRHAPKTLAYVNVDEANGGVMVDISETGMSIASAEALGINGAPRLRFQLPRIDRTFEVSAEVVWSSDSKTKAGVRFVSMPIDERVQIRNWIKDELFAEAFPTRVANTMVPRRRLPFSFDMLNDASSGAGSAPREARPRVPAKELPDIPVKIASHTMEAFEKMFPSESTLGPQIVKRAERAPVAPSQTHIDTAALWMNFPSERDVAPRVVEYDEESVVAEDAVPAAGIYLTPLAELAPDFIEEAAAPAEVAAPALLIAPVEEAASAPIIEEVAAALPIEECAKPLAIEETPHVDALASAPAETLETPLGAAQPPFTPVIVQEVASPSPAPIDTPSTIPAVAESAVAEASSAPVPEVAQPPAATALLISEFAVAPPAPDTLVEEPADVPVHELNPEPEGPAFAALHMDAVDISQAIRAPGKFSGGAVSDASIESLLAIAEAEEASAPPRMPLRVVPDQKPAQPRAAAPVRQSAKTALTHTGAVSTSLPHVALRTAAQQSVAPQNLIDADRKFHGLLIAAAIVFLALCFVIGYSHNIQLPWTKDRAPANATPAQPDPSAAPASDAAPSSSSQSTPPPTTAPVTNDGSQPPLPDSASIAPSSKFEAPALPATPAAPTPSYFPVTAPAEGNAPRMVELPEKTVFDSPKVLIQLRQYFFVPPQAGPEWSHKLDQILIGEPMLKMPPPPANDADPSVVQLRATFGKDGAVKNVRPINGPVALIPRSVEAVRQWRYQPSILDGAPLEWQGDFTIEFRPAS